MNAIFGFLMFAAAWLVLSIVFGKFVGRPMLFGEGFIYSIALVLAVAAISSKFGPSKEERLAKDIQEYNRLTEQVRRDDAKLNLLDECVRQHRTSDPDCQRAATGASNH